MGDYKLCMSFTPLSTAVTSSFVNWRRRRKLPDLSLDIMSANFSFYCSVFWLFWGITSSYDGMNWASFVPLSAWWLQELLFFYLDYLDRLFADCVREWERGRLFRFYTEIVAESRDLLLLWLILSGWWFFNYSWLVLFGIIFFYTP